MNRLLIKLLLLCFLSSGTISVLAQAGVLEIYGLIKDDASKKKLEGAMVIVYKDGAQFDTYDAGGSGKFELSVPLGAVYDFKFSKTGYSPKIVRFDTKSIPAEDQSGGFQTNIDISLFTQLEGFNPELLKEPIGIARFDSQLNSVEFDNDYTEKQMTKIENELKRLQNASKDDEKKKKDFEALVLAGDKLIGETKYADGIQKYSEALALFPTDAPVKKKKEDAQKKLDELNANKDLEAKYKKAIDDGNANMKSSSYANARKNFEEASKLKPTESLPKDKLAEITDLEKNAEAKKKYDAAIAEADKKFGAKDYSGSISKYQEAQTLMPKLTYPAERIKEAEDMLASNAKQKQYDELIANADKEFKAKSYQSAIDEYKKAQALIPSESYPKSQIDAATKAMVDEASAAKVASDRKRYDDLIKEADKLFKSKSFSESIDQYKQAQAVLTDEAYPKNQITLAEKAMGDAANSAKQAADRKKYDDLISDADKKFANKDYAVAIEKYQAAQQVLSSEPYPKDQILKAQTALDAILANESDKIKRQKEFDDKVKMAEQNVSDNKLEAAINFYKDAQRIKPEEPLPGSRIKEIQTMIDATKKAAEANSATAKADNEKAEREKRYQALISEADAAFDKDDLNASQLKYEEALTIKSDAAYPKTKLDRIKLLLEEREKDALAAKSKSESNAAAKAKADADAAELAQKKADLEAKAKADQEAALRKLQEEKEARDRAKPTSSGDWITSADEKAEGDLEEYYRNARKLEEQARYKAIEDKKARHESLLKDGDARSEESRSQKRDDLNQLETAKQEYADAGEDRNRNKTNELIQRKDEYNSFQKNKAQDAKELIEKNLDKATNQRTGQANLTSKGADTITESAIDKDKKKKEQQENKSTYQSTSESRIESNKEKNAEVKQQQENLKANNRYQENKSEKLAERKSELKEQVEERTSKNADIQSSNIEKVEQKKEQALSLIDKGTEKQQATAERIQEKNNTAVQNLEDKRSASNEQSQLRLEKIENTKESHLNIADGKDETREQRAQDIATKKTSIELATIEQRQKSLSAQQTAKERLELIEKGERKSEDEYLLVEGTETLPEGVTENSYKLGEKMVTERTVKMGNKIDKYRKVVSKTGTYYFKNGKSISEGTWRQETLKTKRS